MNQNQNCETDILDLALGCARVMDDKKGTDILLLDLRDVNSYLEYFLIITGNSHMHCRAMAKEVQKFMHDGNYPSRSKPQLDSGWIVLDYNEIVVHIFTLEFREYYQLERLWADAKILIKI